MQDDPQPKDEYWQPPMPEPVISPDIPPFPHRPTLRNVVQEGTIPTIGRKVRPTKQRQLPSLPHQHQPRKYSVGELFGFGCASLVVLGGCLLILTGILNRVNSSPTSDTSSSGSSVAAVGQSITVDGLTTTLVSVRVLSTGSNDSSPPQFGDEYIVVNVKFVNNGPGNVAYFAHDFHVVSGTGNVTDAQVVPSVYPVNQTMDGGTLSVGGSTTGAMIFQVAVGDHNARLTWQPIFIDSTTTYSWNLGL